MSRLVQLPDDRAIWLEMARAGLLWEEALTHKYLQPVKPESLVCDGELDCDEDFDKRLRWTQPYFRMGIMLED